MKPRHLLVTLAVFGSLAHASACSSRFRNDNDDDASAGGTGGTVASGGSGGVSGAAGSPADGSSTGGSADSGGTGGNAGTGGSGGSAGTGGSSGSSGTGGTLLDQGAECSRGTDCKTQICGVTADAENLCCAEACNETQVCSGDGSSCENAAACAEELERCSAEGNRERCSDGQWDLLEDCEDRGCSLEFGGCLSTVGTTCVENEECAQGTCQETAEGDAVCCDASCGSCQVCTSDGTGCEEPAEVKPGCDCTEADASNCDDNLPCTVDTCQDGACSNEVESGYCLIDGQCYDHNQPEPGNGCRYCDASLRDRAWTNSANIVSCDDGAWCNGADTCNGTGQCLHQFPTLARCTESGPCALTSCDEDRDSCYQPDSFACATVTDDRCRPVDSAGAKCPGAIQRRTTETFCSGASTACDGEVTVSDYVTIQDCGGTCDADTVACIPTLPCATACDGSTGLCWTKHTDEGGAMTLGEAEAYCEALVAGSSDDWRLPTIDEWLGVAKGCDEATGEPQAQSFQSTCTFDPDNDDPATVCESPCPDSAGPADGCYWRSSMDECSTVGYWSSTAVSGGRLVFVASSNWVVQVGPSTNHPVRCVAQNPN